MGGEAVRSEALATACIADRSERWLLVERVAGESSRHRPAVLGTDLLGDRLGTFRRQAVESTTEQGEDEVVSVHGHVVQVARTPV